MNTIVQLIVKHLVFYDTLLISLRTIFFKRIHDYLGKIYQIISSCQVVDCWYMSFFLTQCQLTDGKNTKLIFVIRCMGKSLFIQILLSESGQDPRSNIHQNRNTSFHEISLKMVSAWNS